MNYKKPSLYTNRELSWLKFNERVLSEAKDHTIPSFERLKFLSITASNLDEFFMVRVASLKDMVHAGYKKEDIAGMTPEEQLAAINSAVHAFTAAQYQVLNRSLFPMLKRQGLNLIRNHEDLTKDQAKYVDKYFMKNVYPVLTPMAVDSSRPFPLVRNKTLNIAALLSKKNKKGKEELDFATVQVPSGLPRVLLLQDSEDGTRNAVFLEQIIERNIQKLFTGYKVVDAAPYRIMRNADLSIDEEDAADLLKEIEKKIRKRQWGEVIRLEVEEGMNKRLLKTLRRELLMREEDIYHIHGPLDLTFLMKVYSLPGFDHLKEKPYQAPSSPILAGEGSIFRKIRKRDLLMNHPFDSFDPVVEFVKQAANDPDVLAIKQTLYRVSGHSPIVAALAKAAENGKQVSVLVELKARFDEENNIGWARRLEKAGCHVIYGLVGLKTHCKITLVVRKEEEGIRRYVHLGTGNYNDSTAKLYTDMGMFTCRPEIGEDATAVFNMLSGYSEPDGWNHLVLAPLWLRDKFMELIEREEEHAKAGEEAHIIAKMNSLCDQKIIAALYKASAAGVKIDLIIRGICCLKVGIPGVSENITVRSIVGTFLEHSRIFYFANGGQEEIYMGSADWMPRNLDRRVEILFPVLDEKLKNRAKGILLVQLQDTAKAHNLQPDGTYTKEKVRGKAKFNSQMYFCKDAQRKALPKKEKTVKDTRRFIPRTHQE